MFDIGGWEFLVIAVLAIVIIGPKDLPATVRMVTMWLRKLRGFARDFQSGLDDIAREADLDDVQKEITDGIGGGALNDSMNSIKKQVEEAVDPTGEISDALDPAADDLGGEDAGDGEDASKRRALAEADDYDDDDFDFDEENEYDDDDGDQVAAVSEQGEDADDAAETDAVTPPQPEPQPAPKTKTGT